jgi:hypothetical protein
MITAKQLRDLIFYDPETGLCTWLVSRGNRKRGSGAGCINGSGYIDIKIEKIYQVHRLAFLYMTGEWPKNEVDHINMIRSDNRWCNLRAATRSQNFANQHVYSCNPTGYKGVMKYYHKWIARIRVNGTQLYLGLYPTPEEAHAAYCVAAKKHFGDFARLK